MFRLIKGNIKEELKEGEECNYLIPNEKYTIFGFTEWGFPYHRHIRFLKLSIGSYAQYSECINICFQLKSKRKPTGLRIYGNKKLYITKGWIEVNTVMLRNDGPESRLCFDELYMKDAIESVKQDILEVGIK